MYMIFSEFIKQGTTVQSQTMRKTHTVKRISYLQVSFVFALNNFLLLS